jgi:hypothetical protein
LIVEAEHQEVTLSSISATYTGGDVPVGTSLSSLTGLTVKATYSDGSTANVTDYTLSGTINEGSNTITVSYDGKTTTFKVTGVAQSSGGGGLVVKRGTTTSETINTGLLNIKHFMLNVPSLSAVGLIDLMYDEENGAVYTCCTEYGVYAKYGAYESGTGSITIQGGTFKWNGTDYKALASGQTYNWIAVGEE